jgi:hypothetical protein
MPFFARNRQPNLDSIPRLKGRKSRTDDPSPIHFRRWRPFDTEVARESPLTECPLRVTVSAPAREE